jgi:hypothetical protein
MTKQASFKRRVRARMAKTGESYATARSRLLAGQAGTTPDDSPRFLGEAFDQLSLEYPAMRDGLSLTERRVLAAVADGAPDAGTAFVRAGSRETRPYMGDTACFGRMDRMA